jgi:hypothetical protein
MVRPVMRGYALLTLCLIGWPSTHVAIYITKPPESSWVFHLLLAISWLALVLTAWDIIETAKVREKEE